MEFVVVYIFFFPYVFRTAITMKAAVAHQSPLKERYKYIFTCLPVTLKHIIRHGFPLFDPLSVTKRQVGTFVTY